MLVSGLVLFLLGMMHCVCMCLCVCVCVSVRIPTTVERHSARIPVQEWDVEVDCTPVAHLAARGGLLLRDHSPYNDHFSI